VPNPRTFRVSVTGEEWDILRGHHRPSVRTGYPASLPGFNVVKRGDKRSELQTQEMPRSPKDPHVAGTLVTLRTQ